MRKTSIAAMVIVVAILCHGAWADPRVTLTENGGVLVDGEPFLPVFVWAQPSSTIAMHKALGVNTLHPGEKEESDPSRAYLDKLQAAGMMGLFGHEKLNDATKGHPALLAWTVEHEPDMAQKPGFTPDLSGDARVIWIEAEKPAKNTLKHSGWLGQKNAQLSGGQWLTSEKEGTGEAVFEFEVKTAGKYNLWIREFDKSWANPTRWKIGDGEPQETPRTLRSEAVTNLGAGRGVGWTSYGAVDLPAGKNTMTIQIVPGRTLGNADKEPGADAIWAVDVICFTTAAKYPPAKSLEPTPKRLPAVQKANRDAVKAADPDALTWNILTSGIYGGYRKLPLRYYDEFIKYTDIVSFDHYPVTGWNRPDRVPEVALVTREYKSRMRKGQLLITIVEASDQDLSWTAKETRGPNAAEMRAEVWSSIAAGAKGIGYFTIAFNPFRWNNLTDEIKEELKHTNGELTELTAPIVLGDTDKKLTVTGDDTDDKAAAGHAIQAVRKEHDGKTYVIAVNVTRAKVTPTFTLEAAPAAARAQVWKENRRVAVAAGAFSDDFEPLAVHVYVLP